MVQTKKLYAKNYKSLYYHLRLSRNPQMLLRWVRHFFLTYKDLDGAAKNVEITHVYGKEEAFEVIKLASEDYTEKYGDVNESLVEALLAAVK